MKLFIMLTVLLCSAATTVVAQTRTFETHAQDNAGEALQGTQGLMRMDIIDVSNPTPMSFNHPSGSNPTISFSGSSIAPIGPHGSFAFSVFVESANVVVGIVVSTSGTGTVSVLDVSAGTTTPLTTGSLTLLLNQRYMFQGDSGDAGDFGCLITWEEISGSGISSIVLDGHASLFYDNDLVIRTTETETSSITFRGPRELRMRAFANVSSSTLTILTNGEDTLVTIPVGEHTINLTGLGLLSIDFLDDDEGMPEDINGDGVVDVVDLLLVISAWTMP